MEEKKGKSWMKKWRDRMGRKDDDEGKRKGFKMLNEAAMCA
jgi:hypothetical protein